VYKYVTYTIRDNYTKCNRKRTLPFFKYVNAINVKYKTNSFVQVYVHE